mgnify:CR=1 FL=1
MHNCFTGWEVCSPRHHRGGKSALHGRGGAGGGADQEEKGGPGAGGRCWRRRGRGARRLSALPRDRGQGSGQYGTFIWRGTNIRNALRAEVRAHYWILHGGSAVRHTLEHHKLFCRICIHTLSGRAEVARSPWNSLLFTEQGSYQEALDSHYAKVAHSS